MVDGDTIKVKQYGVSRYFTVRLIGIDTPETKRPGRPVECGGKQAFARMLRLSFTAAVDSDADTCQPSESNVCRG